MSAQSPPKEKKTDTQERDHTYCVPCVPWLPSIYCTPSTFSDQRPAPRNPLPGPVHLAWPCPQRLGRFHCLGSRCLWPGSSTTAAAAASTSYLDSAGDEPPSRFPDLVNDEKPTGRYTPDLLAGVYRGIRKLPSVKLSRSPSRLHLKSSSGSLHSAHSSTSSAPPASEAPPQHARNLTLQYSLSKPLPRSPPYQESIHPQDSTSPNLPSVPEGQIPSPKFFDQSPSTSPLPTPPPKTESFFDSRSSTMESSSAPPQHPYGAHEANNSMSSVSSASRYDSQEQSDGLKPRGTGSASAGPSPSVAQRATPVGGPSNGPSTHLSGLMCNVHRTTGREPHALVGATTTILGDKLYVFGGRILSRSRPAPLTSDMYELDLIRRHWTKLETTGDVPPPRYFHSMCALGDTKMVCYGGMSPAPNQPPGGDQQQPEITVMSDIYIYDVNTRAWTFIPTQDPPQGRYAHCACILPSSATFSSHRAPLSALQHNPSTGNPNEGRIGINIDGSGGAEMVIVGGQDGRNNYIEQISVFNLRSLKWTSTQPLDRSWGAYRSVTAPLPPSVASKLGRRQSNGMQRHDGGISQEAREPGASMLIYCNYNFLDVKLELQIRAPDGTLTERPMSGNYSPPGLRFPNGGVIDTHFVVSGTYLTSSRQEYALWALDLRTLTWSRIDAGGSVFSQGSWNRGVLWNRRNTFVILGNRKRSLVDDYNHRRINFSNVCMVELEAFGFYDNPRKTSPLSGFISASSPYAGPGLSLARKAGYTAGGRYHSRASEELGEKSFAMRELADMDILCIGGERIPVNSRIVGRRWGPYFVQLLREGTATQDGSDAMTLRSGLSSNPLRASAITITPNSRVADSSSSMISTVGSSLSSSGAPSSTAASSFTTGAMSHEANPTNINAAPTPHSLPPNSRPRCLYLPHTYLTIQALLHFLYTSSLPPPTSPLCTPQILCSLLQIARPYRIDGLLEAVVERLHALLDSRNAAAVFNATAMAAGGGRGIDGSLNPNFFVGTLDPVGSPTATSDFSLGHTPGDSFSSDLQNRTEGLTLNTNVQQLSRPSSDELSATTSQSGSEWSSSEIGGSERDNFVWNGELSSVIGLQKRGLRGLMEGRRMRERTGTAAGGNGVGPSYTSGQGQQRVGLGIAGS
ncbi:hypothetical protein H9Q69_003639 [Fusarium xylarioides]|uniref:Uncharacterized protein n=1 Tax=Fusarium xylarioides TaxID=221167 RepID=A0A9P7HXR9_9HYPO|nr:hypothetical protein H9Q70_001525 [Fusarium xylarioides]KAG5765555.1 hypothetical protein H9Q72_006364 [Fusarium xylarioides]KAG5783668.1 hypothetical protein H9Q73_002699 [Fusarium xylarioides]KAG5797335.1 hypothetical protein H9Q69_003639 [Fusarium xylarioides]KAG5810908.1 hypothetical protein H9Q71_005197 [Fusarium xylarioides]